MWNGQGYMAILELESPARMLAIPGPRAGLRQAGRSGTRFGGLHSPWARSELLALRALTFGPPPPQCALFGAYSHISIIG